MSICAHMFELKIDLFFSPFLHNSFCISCSLVVWKEGWFRHLVIAQREMFTGTPWYGSFYIWKYSLTFRISGKKLFMNVYTLYETHFFLSDSQINSKAKEKKKVSRWDLEITSTSLYLMHVCLFFTPNLEIILCLSTGELYLVENLSSKVEIYFCLHAFNYKPSLYNKKPWKGQKVIWYVSRAEWFKWSACLINPNIQFTDTGRITSL